MPPAEASKVHVLLISRAETRRDERSHRLAVLVVRSAETVAAHPFFDVVCVLWLLLLLLFALLRRHVFVVCSIEGGVGGSFGKMPNNAEVSVSQVSQCADGSVGPEGAEED